MYDETSKWLRNWKTLHASIPTVAEIYDVKKYNSKTELIKDSKKHLASKSFQNNKYGFLIKNAKPFRIPIPVKGKLGFFEVKLEQKKIKKSKIIADLIDEEYRYQWIGHH